jgi:uncharacterized protein (DUF2236 family)
MAPRRHRPLLPPRFLLSRLETALQNHLDAASGPTAVDFSRPPGEPALTAPDSISWRVFENPLSLVIGGITAVILELAEPRVRSGVWDHTTFRSDPLSRMRRTGLAAMVTVYGARSVALPMIAGVRRIHEKVSGTTPCGFPYRASDPDLLRWVHATAAFGFLEAYHRFVLPLAPPQRDRYFAEGTEIAKLYGADQSPASEADWHRLLDEMLPRLENSEIISHFLQIIQQVPILPRPFALANRLLIRAAIEILPPPVRHVLQLERAGLPPGAATLLRQAGALAERIPLTNAPAARARLRLGISAE